MSIMERARALTFAAIVGTGLLTTLALPPGPESTSRTAPEWNQKFLGGESVSSAGDANGDRKSDLLIVNDSQVWVVFGNNSDRILDLRSMDASGYQIQGPSSRPLSAAPVGDINGDGFDDVLLGDRRGTVAGRGRPGVAYIVFGKASEAPVSLADMGNASSSAGYKVLGGTDFDFAGAFLSGGRDINSDGLDDFLVGAPFAGATYVVFGQSSNRDVDLRDFDMNVQGLAGYRITTPRAASSGSYSVSDGGDFNGDGLPDALIGVDWGWGSVFVVHGKADPLPIDVRSGGDWGLRIRSSRATGYIGIQTSGAGDFNNDSLDDVALHSGSEDKDRVYIVEGRAGTGELRLADIERKTSLGGLSQKSLFGQALAFGDLNGDEYSDVLIGAPGGSAGATNGGSIYSIFGASTRNSLDVRSLGTRGFRIDGKRRHLYLGYYLDSIPDLDNDGVDEIAAGTLGDGSGPSNVYVYMSGS